LVLPILDNGQNGDDGTDTRRDHDADSLRQHAAGAGDAYVVRRLLALALLSEDHGRAEAAKSCGMDRRTLRDWVIRYNEQGGCLLESSLGAAAHLQAFAGLRDLAWGCEHLALKS
jgi:hypothetical protein